MRNRNNSSKTRIGLLCLIIVFAVASVVMAAAPNLIGAFYVKGKVGLKWQKADGVSEYHVYRKSSDTEFEKIGTTDDDHYFDTEITPGASYTYKITIIEGGAELSSREKSVTIPGAKAGEFSPPAWSGVRLDQDKVFLKWDPVPTAIAYNIHRSESEDGTYEIVGSAQAAKYADKSGLVKGVTYYYKVSALNSDFDETELSEPRAIKYGMSREEMAEMEASNSKIQLVETKLTELFEVTEISSDEEMNQPADVFVNSAGNIYITDALNAKVRCFDPNGKYLFSFGERTEDRDIDNPPPATFRIPFTLFIDKQDQVFVTDIENHDIQVFTPEGKFVRRIHVNTGNGMKPLRPNGIHVLDDGRIVLTDTGNHRFLIIDQEGKILQAYGERGSETGQFNFPDELTVAPDNTIYVVDVLNCRVQQFDMKGNFIRAFGEVGQSAGTFARPKSIVLDENGRLWVADGMSNVIQGFSMEGEVQTALGAQEGGATFMTPRGIFFKNGKFYVVNRVPHKLVVYKVG